MNDAIARSRSSVTKSAQPAPVTITAGVVKPLAGSGSGGAAGPFKITALSALPALTGPLPRPSALRIPSYNVTPPIDVIGATAVTTVASAEVESEVLAQQPSGGQVAPPTSSPGVFSNGSITASGASDGNILLATDTYSDIYMYSATNGSALKTISWPEFWCNGVNALPACKQADSNPTDTRAMYDYQANRYIITTLFADYNHSNTNSVVQDFIAVSQTEDPRGAWNLYQFPACGAYDTWDGSDQPHAGFTSQWITVTSACEANPQNPNQVGDSLAVFDKSALYAGQSLNLNGNWFEFADPVELSPDRDNPALTYTNTINNRQYLTSSGINSAGNTEFIFSHVEGTTDAPVFYSSTETVTLPYGTVGTPDVSTEACSSCLGYTSNSWVHSSGVYALKNGTPTILATIATGDPALSGSTQIVSVAVNKENGTANAMQLEGGEVGSGPMTSAIGMPLTSSYADNVAVFSYDHSRSDFNPGIKYGVWDIDTNSIDYINTLKAGDISPTGADLSRWVDSMNELAPIPGTANVLIGGSVATDNSNSYYNDRASYYQIVTP